MKSAASWLRSSLWSSMVLAVALSVTGCVGAVDRADFDAAMQSRGGGMTTSLVRDGLAALSARYGVAEVQVTSVDVAPVETLDVTVRNPAKPDQLDQYTFDGEWLSDPSPVMVSALEDLDARAFRIGDVPALGRVEALVDDALAHSGVDGGRVTGISVNRTEGFWPTVMDDSPPVLHI
ncbi:hypothetical protein [Rhodococcus jostii]|uniref:hypothetical protein n=1 Tax=Rhodococcus jostii TaxID=132919 RepID=UPI00115FF584|nr:hypothetical protein [Rhodococcus jostii]